MSKKQENLLKEVFEELDISRYAKSEKCIGKEFAYTFVRLAQLRENLQDAIHGLCDEDRILILQDEIRQNQKYLLRLHFALQKRDKHSDELPF